MSQTTPIRVMIVDDHAVVRGGLKYFLLAFDDMELVGEADSGEKAVQLCPTIQPDVVLMDMVMPGMDGAEATRRIREKCPRVQVVALTSFQEDDLIQKALRAGDLGLRTWAALASATPLARRRIPKRTRTKPEMPRSG